MVNTLRTNKGLRWQMSILATKLYLTLYTDTSVFKTNKKLLLAHRCVVFIVSLFDSCPTLNISSFFFYIIARKKISGVINGMLGTLTADVFLKLFSEWLPITGNAELLSGSFSTSDRCSLSNISPASSTYSSSSSSSSTLFSLEHLQWDASG